MRLAYKVFLLAVATFLASYLLMSLFTVPHTKLGDEVIKFWCGIRGNYTLTTCEEMLNYSNVYHQVLSLGLFLLVVGLTVISTKLRYSAAFLSIALLVFAGVVPPQELISGVEWRLIFFLIGSMTFAYILRKLRVFEHIAIKILSLSTGSPYLLIIFLSLFAWFLALAVDEVTSIVYVMMLVLDIRKITRYDVKPLIILAVLATNTGSMALPVGNPIGIYVSYEARLTVTEFLSRALPLSLITLLSMISLTYPLLRNYLKNLSSKLLREDVEAMRTRLYADLTLRERRVIRFGIFLLAGFLIVIALNGPLSELISSVGGFYVDPHSLLSFTPYIFIVLSLTQVRAEELEVFITRGVEWPSILFFIALFMLGHSLLWSGAASKIAYLSLSVVASGSSINYGLLNTIFLLLSTILSSVLDNLSVIVAMTPVAKIVNGLTNSKSVFWVLLYGGTLGGNYTPIGSTANIVALGMCDKARIYLDWSYWLKIAFLTTTLQVIISLLWSYLIL
jgi:Na+/H+ antiporter NhaD/arsenite permease-like protein